MMGYRFDFVRKMKTKAERLGWKRMTMFDKIPRQGILPTRSEIVAFYKGSKFTDEEAEQLTAKHGWLKKLVD